MFSKKVSVLYLIIAATLGSVLTFFVFFFIQRSNAANTDAGNTSADINVAGGYNIQRDPRNYKYISPIISVEPINESEKYAAIKTEIQNYIDNGKQNGSLISASVYLKDFTKGDWFAINPSERYNPGSLVKVGVLMTYLRMAEGKPKFLDKEVTYHGEKGFVFPIEYYKSDTVVEGHKYKISDLLQYMIKYSDNRATVYLENYMDTTIFKKEFADLGITEPRFNDPTYALNVKEYSMMFKALYNAGYLKRKASENALGLLTESTFKNGLLKELPASAVVAHKFGEAGDLTLHELHESGIVYLNNNPYMITVMTKGTNWDKLSDAIGHISKMAYDKMTLSPEGQTTYHTTAAE